MKRMMTKVGSVLVLAFALVIASTSTADAAATLRLSSGGDVITITDNELDGGGDDDALFGITGTVLFAGSVGDFSLTITSGNTKPVLGTAGNPIMDLDIFATSLGAGTLTVEFSDTDYTGVGSGRLVFAGEVAAGAGSDADYSAYFDAGNALFVQGSLIGSIDNQTGVFSETESGPGPGTSPFSLTQVVTITHTGAGFSDVNASLTIPEPATMALFGMGLVGLAGAARRRARKQASQA